MKNVQKGFTLIELMIVVAIIGILAAIALPAYQDYTKRSHVSEGLSLAGAAKLALTEYYADKGDWPADNTAAGLAAATAITGNSVKSVTVSKDAATGKGKIVILYNSKVTDDADIILYGSYTADAGAVKWTCTDGSVDKKYRPATCRS